MGNVVIDMSISWTATRVERRGPERFQSREFDGRARRFRCWKMGSAPESRPEVARPPKVTLRRPEDPGAPRCARSRGGPPPPPQTDGPPPSRSLSEGAR
jgi:hypothetical protein